MNKFIPTRIVPIATLVLGLLAVAVLPKVQAGAVNQPVNDKPPEPAVTQPQPRKTEAPSDTNAAQKPPVTRSPAKPVKEFKPTESIGADSAVSFPVDI